MSFEIALSGINAVNRQLGSISNNIANTGTYGYKSGRITFASSYAGMQPMGVEANANSQNIGRSGGLVSTGRALDAALQGKGFFVTRDPAGGMSYTRVGIFNTDKEGFLTDHYGRKVQGFAKVDGGGQGALGDIQVPTGNVPAKASDKLEYAGNLSAGWEVLTKPFDKSDSSTFQSSAVSTLYDSLGNKHSLTQYYSKTADNTVTVNYTLDGKPVGTPTALQFDTNGKLTAPTAAVALNLGTPAGASPLAINLDYTGTTQFAGEASTTVNASNGFASGARTGVSLGENGDVIVSYSNGQKQTVATIAVANFPNENALVAGAETSWKESEESGTALYSTPASGMAGGLASGALEQSNVDMTAELVDLMTAQRNYQANTKVISAQNQVVQSLMQAL